MAIRNMRTNEVTYSGAVFGKREHYWLDGMLEVYSEIWDIAEQRIKEVTTGYIAITGQDLSDNIGEIDIDKETARNMIRAYKKKAIQSYTDSVIREKNKVKAGRNVEVIRGRKVKKGTILRVFWCGEKETYKSRQYHWLYETELIAGCYDEDGNKVWIKAEYLKVIDDIKSPKSIEREKYIKNYIKRNIPGNVLQAAMGE